MSAPKWTSGPWRIGLRLNGDRGSEVEIDGLGDDLPWSALATVVVRMDGAHLDSEEGVANAHLIAASPKLYAALERQSALVEALAKCRKAGGVHIYDVDGEALFVNLLRTLEPARAALAKARGEG